MSYRWLQPWVVIFGIWVGSVGVAQSLPPQPVIASAHPLATQAGYTILQQGGNAFDAAVAVAAALAVVEPYASGIGGGGFWLLHEAQYNKDLVIDGREVAPMAASADMFLDEAGEPIAGMSLYGPKAAGIPGTPAALVYITEKYGQLTLAENLAPAIELARNGFAVGEDYRNALQQGDKYQRLQQQFPAAAEIFVPQGKLPAVGQVIVQSDLANTLTLLAEQGRRGFYAGTLAQQLVDAVQAQGGLWTLADLADYQLKIREPLVGQYGSIKIVTTPLPSAGGVGILTMLNVLQGFDLANVTEVERNHLIIEAMRLAFWDRSRYLGDADFVDVPMNRLLSAEHAAQLREHIKLDQATPSAQLSVAPMDTPKGHSTSHFSIIDTQGNRVGATLSINYFFGSGVVPPGTGVLLNNHMDDFAMKAGQANVYQLVGHALNEIAPGKRPLSSMAPTFAITEDRIAVIGTPGGSRIPTMILLALLAFADDQLPAYWVSLPRYHHQYLPDVVEYEPDAFSEWQQNELQAMGYVLKPLGRRYGNMQATLWDKVNQRVYAASDERRDLFL
ncbi:MAG: gamma-glutamyltransferase [Legionellales bacterium]|nr:gamma-glutamyltransferase [Legionellales bacterium]